jgi:hypothetical protein
MISRTPAAVVLMLVATLTSAACTGPARTAADYRAKARHSAVSASSAVATSGLAARLVRDGGAFASYIAVVLDSAERDATGVDSSFGSVQPPDAASDRLRDQLSSVLGDVVDTVSAMRISARRHDWDALLRTARQLPSLEAELAHFEQLPA